MLFVFFFFKQKTAYEMRISDWSSDVCSSDLGVDAALVGQRAVAFVPYGGIAEYVVADVHLTAPIAAGLDDAFAASLVVTYGTVWHALADRARLRSGEKMLVTGASGGVGQAAVLLGKARGAVAVAAASSAEKADAARPLGAEQAFVLPAEGQ